MMKHSIAPIICTLFFLPVIAQQKNIKPQPYKFFSSVQAGILDGQAKKTAGQIQLLSGIQKNAWLAGIGVGIDYYSGKRSIPLFIDVKNILLKTSYSPFVYASGGYNFSWLRDDEKISGWNIASSKQKGGVFYEIGLGYRFPLKNKMALGISAGYSYKQQSETVTPFQSCDFCVPRIPEPMPEIYKYQFRRIGVKVHCWF